MTTDWSAWGPLAERYRQERPRRLLALDGGGIRGLLTLQILDRLESELRRTRGNDPKFRLCQFFDMIAGTSTGAILAAGLARGMSTAELIDFYRVFGREAFTKRPLLERLKSLYSNGPLQKQLQGVFGAETTLEPHHLSCLLLVVTRNATTDSAWPLSSNPSAKYNDLSRTHCNLKVPLWQLVRASTAAPVYFPPEVISLDPTDPSKTFVFVDGGTTAYNNPAFILYRMVTEPAYRLGWQRGEKQMLLVSIGTGRGPVLGRRADDGEENLLGAARNTLGALMSQASFDQDLSCRTIGRCAYGKPLDREVGDLVPRDTDGGKSPLSVDLGRAFLYARYDALLTREGLDDLACRDIQAEKVSAMDSVDHMPELERVGRAVAQEIDLAHFGDFVQG